MRPEDQAAYNEMRKKPMYFSGYERDRFFYNVGRGKHFAEVGYSANLDFEDDGRATAAFDYDGDGDLDLALFSLQSLRLLENRVPARHFLELQLRATSSQHHALGAIAEVRSASRAGRDYVKATHGFATGVSLAMHFGLGDDTEADVTITWPNGKKEEFKGLAAD